ncbi:hypothetical protein [Mycolicibacterium brisbanense]
MTTARRVLLSQQNMDGRPELMTWGTAILFGSTTAELSRWVDRAVTLRPTSYRPGSSNGAGVAVGRLRLPSMVVL